ncbi:MAG TPA: 2-phosphosulfolactate phosphatase [Prolixibacteraceae bacterium]|mgnify:CR=1 FL=1|nr:2-phosphosulfolactate phosphatase [Prolixibacteraceae bacterium]HPS13336.1 2-phosphosulfolactate phosphatase [Prolixibacteraceae bacterium]
MKIEKWKLVEGSREARGTVVIIDVFRAFSVSCYLVANGAERIYPVGSVEEARRLKEQNPEYVLIGERKEKMCEGFDFGNSPTHILHQNFTGKTVIHTTSSGTQGICNAVHASEILTGSFVNAKAIVAYLQQTNPPLVSLVGMGYEGIRPSQEDDFCADYIENELLGLETDFDIMKSILRTGDGARLLDPKNHDHSPASDFDLCLDRDKFNFVLVVKKDELGQNYLAREDVTL